MRHLYGGNNRRRATKSQIYPLRHALDIRAYSTVVSIVSTHISAVVHASCISGPSISAGSGPSVSINDTAVDTIIRSVDDGGNVVDELDGVMMVF